MTTTNGRPSILLAGAGGHARACIDVIEQEGRFAIAGLTGLAEEVGSSVLGYPVLGTEADLPRLVREHRHGLVTVGQIKTPALRMQLFAAFERCGAVLPAIVSPRAWVSPHATIGAGTIVMHGAVVNAAASVGGNCILNTLSLVEHDARVGDHCHIATRAALNSGVSVGDGTFVGSGTTVRQGLRIGAGCVIGMGQRILTDCRDGARIPPPKVTA